MSGRDQPRIEQPEQRGPKEHLKILHILKHTGKANGNVCCMVDLACMQASNGHDVYVCSGGGHFDDVFNRYGVHHQVVDHAGSVRQMIAATPRLYRMMRDIDPDIVHGHMMASAVVAAALKPLFRYRLITTVHNEFQPSAILMGVGNKVIGVSESVSRSMRRRGVPASRMRTVLNGAVHSPRFPEQWPSPATLERPSILYLGGLHPRKGVDILIEAFGSVLQSGIEAHLYLVGSGPMQADYEALASRCAPGRVSFLGHSDDPRHYLQSTDIFVLPSRSEPAGLVLAEAREAGCAVIGSNVGGIPEMLENGQAGLLVAPNSPESLAATLLELLRDGNRLEEMRRRAQINIEHVSVERMARDTERVYREALCKVAGANEQNVR